MTHINVSGAGKKGKIPSFAQPTKSTTAKSDGGKKSDTKTQTQTQRGARLDATSRSQQRVSTRTPSRTPSPSAHAKLKSKPQPNQPQAVPPLRKETGTTQEMRTKPSPKPDSPQSAPQDQGAAHSPSPRTDSQEMRTQPSPKPDSPQSGRQGATPPPSPHGSSSDSPPVSPSPPPFSLSVNPDTDAQAVQDWSNIGTEGDTEGAIKQIQQEPHDQENNQLTTKQLPTKRTRHLSFGPDASEDREGSRFDVLQPALRSFKSEKSMRGIEDFSLKDKNLSDPNLADSNLDQSELPKTSSLGRKKHPSHGEGNPPQNQQNTLQRMELIRKSTQGAKYKMSDPTPDRPTQNPPQKQPRLTTGQVQLEAYSHLFQPKHINIPDSASSSRSTTPMPTPSSLTEGQLTPHTPFTPGGTEKPKHSFGDSTSTSNRYDDALLVGAVQQPMYDDQGAILTPQKLVNRTARKIDSSQEGLAKAFQQKGRLGARRSFLQKIMGFFQWIKRTVTNILVRKPPLNEESRELRDRFNNFLQNNADKVRNLNEVGSSIYSQQRKQAMQALKLNRESDFSDETRGIIEECMRNMEALVKTSNPDEPQRNQPQRGETERQLPTIEITPSNPDPTN